MARIHDDSKSGLLKSKEELCSANLHDSTVMYKLQQASQQKTANSTPKTPFRVDFSHRTAQMANSSLFQPKSPQKTNVQNKIAHFLSVPRFGAEAPDFGSNADSEPKFEQERFGSVSGPSRTKTLKSANWTGPSAVPLGFDCSRTRAGDLRTWWWTLWVSR